ncbi:MAG: trigger factor [Arsenophonus sp. ET-KM2-MAG3]
MQFSFETIQDLWRRVTITIPNITIEKAVNSELTNLSKRVFIDGFRKGKVPIDIIKQHYATSVLHKVLNDLMQRNFIEVVTEEKINSTGILKYQYQQEQLKSNKDFIYTVEFEVYPKIKLKGLENIQVEKPIVTIKDEDVNKILEVLCKQKATWRKTKEKVSENSRVTIDFKGTICGKSFEGSDKSNFIFTVKEGFMIPGFKDGIIGHKEGDEFIIEINFPSNYQDMNLKNKIAKFTVTLKKVEQYILPKLTKEFIKQFGIPDGSMEGLCREVRKNMERELKTVIRNRIKMQVLDGLIKENSIKPPSTLVDNEINILRKKNTKNFSKNKKQMLNLSHETFEEQAKYRVIIGLLLGEIINENSLITDDARVKLLIEEMASAYENPCEVIEYYNKNKGLMDSIRNLALEEQIIETLLKKAKITDKEVQFQELINWI